MDLRLKRFPALHDHDTLWFGKYDNHTLSSIPSHYLIWWKDQNYDRYEDISKSMSGNVEKVDGLSENLQRSIKLYNYIHNCQEAFRVENRG